MNTNRVIYISIQTIILLAQIMKAVYPMKADLESSIQETLISTNMIGTLMHGQTVPSLSTILNAKTVGLTNFLSSLQFNQRNFVNTLVRSFVTQHFLSL